MSKQTDFLTLPRTGFKTEVWIYCNPSQQDCDHFHVSGVLGSSTYDAALIYGIEPYGLRMKHILDSNRVKWLTGRIRCFILKYEWREFAHRWSVPWHQRRCRQKSSGWTDIQTHTPRTNTCSKSAKETVEIDARYVQS